MIPVNLPDNVLSAFRLGRGTTVPVILMASSAADFAGYHRRPGPIVLADLELQAMA
jgi:hypothetical protein